MSRCSARVDAGGHLHAVLRQLRDRTMARQLGAADNGQHPDDALRAHHKHPCRRAVALPNLEYRNLLVAEPGQTEFARRTPRHRRVLAKGREHLPRLRRSVGHTDNRGRRCLPVPKGIEHPDPERCAVDPGRGQAAVRRGLDQRSPAWEVRETKGQLLRGRDVVTPDRSRLADDTHTRERDHDPDNDPDPMTHHDAHARPFEVPTRSER